ncbi:GlsB/YeaQ/YmgE family stress response membrane protein [Agrococcus sp. SGAir0287]|uniref:GlsB/YeaQ/YmgE family stress response membrane protein n=1 Tax=Agrococcus sp. SGAir0287 TaxID=2070347 RepID=UPI0010CD0C33|nr:hypothetical protein [Agrococcus sp. SGAir0287]QCR18350.1 hypothetical protein C1N71_01845 [Agrococcus sp. SGAir0287]
MTSRPDDDARPGSGDRDGGDAAGAPTPAEEPAAATDAPVEPAEAEVAAARADASSTEPPVERERSVTVERDDVQVRARLVPRYGRFMVLGAIVGAVGGWLFSRLGSSGPWLGAGPTIDTSAVVPFLVVVGIVVGIVLGAVVAILLERIVGRRRRTLTAERTRHHRDDASD